MGAGTRAVLKVAQIGLQRISIHIEQGRPALMRFAYADPPYLGCCKLYDHHHPDGRCWDYIETHKALADRLIGEYDGFALSLTSQSLPQIAPMFQGVARVAAWVKPFAAFKRNVRIAYTWEPVIFMPGRDSSVDGAPVGRDHLSQSEIAVMGVIADAR